MMTAERGVVYEGMRTPWGDADSARVIVEGVGSVSTPSHGGIKLSAAMNAQVPEYMRKAGGWYEEDCDWCIPFVVFAAELSDGPLPEGRGAVQHEARECLRNWHPAAYERFFGVKLQEGQSFKRDEELFHLRHANDWVTICAFGDWHTKVPKGFVGACASVGGRRGAGAERYFLIPEAEYHFPHSGGFVIDLG